MEEALKELTTNGHKVGKLEPPSGVLDDSEAEG